MREREENTGPMMADLYHIYRNIYKKKSVEEKNQRFGHVKPGKAHMWLIMSTVSISLGVPEGPMGKERITCSPRAPHSQ